MRNLVLICVLVTLFAVAAAPASAQGCGLPTSGAVSVSTTYTLTADCTMTDTLYFGTQDSSASKITITINGGGHAITGSTDACRDNGRNTITVNNNVAFSLNNVTIKNGGRRGGAAVDMRNSAHSATFSNVTFLETKCTALRFDNETTPAITHSLSNVLFQGVSGLYFSPAHGIPTAIHTIGPASLNINNIALRGIFTGNAAIGSNDTYSGYANASIGTITFTGCLTVDGVFPRVWYGDIVDNSAGPCSGTVGNGGSSAMQYPQAPVSACGLPLGGFIYGRQVYNLKSDCATTAKLWIPYESDVVINGNGYTIDGSGFAHDIFGVAGRFRLSNAVVTGAGRYPILTYLNRNMRVSNSIFRDNAGPLVLQDSIVTLEDILIENHILGQSRQIPSALWVNVSARVTIRDSVFRGNMLGNGALYTGRAHSYGPDAVLMLEGGITFENNSPRDISDAAGFLIDSRTGPRPPGLPFLLPRPSPTADEDEDEDESESESTAYTASPPAELCDGKPASVSLGAVACVFRHAGELAVYGLDDQSRGFFMAAATQAQIDALGAGMVAASTDGRAAIFVSENRDVIVSVGPDHEGKVLHIRLESSIHGSAINLPTTYGVPPGLGFAAADQARTNALTDCMVRTNYIVNFRDAPDGSLLPFVDVWGIYNDGMLPYDVTLAALARTDAWFKVDYHGTQGWISEDYVEPQGNCD